MQGNPSTHPRARIVHCRPLTLLSTVTSLEREQNRARGLGVRVECLPVVLAHTDWSAQTVWCYPSHSMQRGLSQKGEGFEEKVRGGVVNADGDCCREEPTAPSGRGIEKPMSVGKRPNGRVAAPALSETG